MHSANLSLLIDCSSFSTNSMSHVDRDTTYVASFVSSYHSGSRNMAASKRFIQVVLLLIIFVATDENDVTTRGSLSFTSETGPPTNTSKFMICAEVSVQNDITSAELEDSHIAVKYSILSPLLPSQSRASVSTAS